MNSHDNSTRRSIRYVIKVDTPRELNGVEKNDIQNRIVNGVPVGSQVSKLKKVNSVNKTSRESRT